MTLQSRVQWRAHIERAGRPAQESRGFAARIAGAIVILAALIFADATPQIARSDNPSRERPMPSACGAEAVARAQREVLGIRPPVPAALA